MTNMSVNRYNFLKQEPTFKIFNKEAKSKQTELQNSFFFCEEVVLQALAHDIVPLTCDIVTVNLPSGKSYLSDVRGF